MTTGEGVKPVKEIELAAEDRARLSRLYEEIAGRNAEMSLIIARALGWNAKDKLLAFSLPAGFPWATVVKSEKIRNLLASPRRSAEAKAADAGSDAGTSPGTMVINSENGTAGVWDNSTQTCHE